MTRIINNLQAVPGRKALILFSNNAPPLIKPPEYFGDSLFRASTTIYQCALPGWNDYWAEFSNCTGGYTIKSKEEKFPEIEQVLRDFDRCYLLGYKPDRKTLESLQDLNFQAGVPQRIITNDHSLRIRLKKPGLKVRTRSGFSDISLRNTISPANISQMRSGRIILSNSPFVAGNLEVTAEALPLYNHKKESVIHAVLHIDGTVLSFRPEPEDGYRVAEVSIFGQASLEGRVVNSYRGTGTFRAPIKSFANRVREGFASTIDVPVPGPGSYELRSTVSQGKGSAMSRYLWMSQTMRVLILSLREFPLSTRQKISARRQMRMCLLERSGGPILSPVLFRCTMPAARVAKPKSRPN